jgi:hypothetical protein
MPYPRESASAFVVLGFLLYVWQSLRSKAEPMHRRNSDLWKSTLVTAVTAVLVFSAIAFHLTLT